MKPSPDENGHPAVLVPQGIQAKPPTFAQVREWGPYFLCAMHWASKKNELFDIQIGKNHDLGVSANWIFLYFLFEMVQEMAVDAQLHLFTVAEWGYFI